MCRYWYALQNGWKHKSELKNFVIQPKLKLNTLPELTVGFLESAEVAVLVLDFDGVLAPHDADQPTPEAESWLQKMSLTLGEQRIAILSNKPKPKRLAYFKKHFPNIQFIYGVAKKPYPDGLWDIANSRGIAFNRLLLVDDRLLTGMLASCLAPCQALYFVNPVKSYRAHFFKELFFSMLRSLERVLVKIS